MPNSPLEALTTNLENWIWIGSINPRVSLNSALSSSEVSSPTMLFIGSPTKLKREKETKATTSITKADWNSLLKKYCIKLRRFNIYKPFKSKGLVISNFHKLIKYFFKRLFQSALVMLVVALVSFSLFNFVGDPINNMVGEETSDEERAELRETLGLNDPVYVQFSRFIGNASKGEFGISYQLRRPVSELIIERLPATIELVVISALIALISGTLLGVYTGINRKGVLSDIILAISLLGVSLPTFVIGILFIYLFAVILGVLPSFGRGEVVDLGFWSTGFLTLSGLKAIILPSVTLSLFQMTYIIRLVRAEMMEILQTDYIKFARARGINEKSVNYKHALKNGLIPVITIAGINIGTLIAFSIITETVFQWPGMGSLFINAVYFVDIPIMSAYMIMVAFIFVMINFIVDITYYFIDPRIRLKEETN